MKACASSRVRRQAHPPPETSSTEGVKGKRDHYPYLNNAVPCGAGSFFRYGFRVRFHQSPTPPAASLMGYAVQRTTCTTPSPAATVPRAIVAQTSSVLLSADGADADDIGARMELA